MDKPQGLLPPRPLKDYAMSNLDRRHGNIIKPYVVANNSEINHSIV